MKAGDVIFVRGTSVISKIVRLFDRGQFSHVAIAVSDSEVIETNWNMRSKIVPFHYKDYEVVSLNLSDSQRTHIKNIASQYQGKLYDYLQVISFLFWGRLNNPRHLICSELVFNLLYDVGYLTDESLRDCTPNELYETLTEAIEKR